MAIPTRSNNAEEVLAQCDEFGHTATTKIGDLSEGGITLAVATEETEVKSGSQREIYTYLRGHTGQTWRGELLNFNANNVAFALGMNEAAANITGTGTPGDPYILVIDPSLFGQQIARLYYAQGTRVDGDIIRAEASTARIYSPETEWTMVQGDPTLIPFMLRVQDTWVIKQWTPA